MIDAHLAVGERPFGFSSPEKLLACLDRHHVQHAVLGPVGRWVAVDNREGNQTLAGWIRRWPDRLSGYATVNPWYGVRAAAELRRALDDGCAGLKLIPAQQGYPLLSSLLDPLLALAADAGAPVYVVTGVPVASEPLQLAELARRHPAVRFVMGRSGRTDFSLDLLPALTAVDNLVAETAHNGGGVIRSLVEAIGAERVLFTSDAPANDLGLELERLRRAELPATARDAVSHGTARRLFPSAAARRE